MRTRILMCFVHCCITEIRELINGRVGISVGVTDSKPCALHLYVSSTDLAKDWITGEVKETNTHPVVHNLEGFTCNLVYVQSVYYILCLRHVPCLVISFQPKIRSFFENSLLLTRINFRAFMSCWMNVPRELVSLDFQETPKRLILLSKNLTLGWPSFSLADQCWRDEIILAARLR